MTVTVTAGRSMRIGNETALSGNETLTSNWGRSLNAEIAIAADDLAVPLVVTKEALDGLLLEADEDLTVKVIGGNPFSVEDFTVLGNLVLGLGGEFTIAGDITDWLLPGDSIWIEGATTAGNNGRYVVYNTAFAAGLTTVDVVQYGSRDDLLWGTINVAAVEVFAAVEPGAALGATLVYKIQQASEKYVLLGAAAFEFLAVGPPGQIATDGDFSWLQADDRILVERATTPGNCQIYTVVTAVYTAPDTLILVEEALAGAEAAPADCTFQHVRTELLIRLVEGVPFLWTREGSVLSPVLEDVTQLLVTNASGVAADLQARVAETV